MPKKGESPYKRTMGLDVPHPFAKEVPKKKPKGRPRGNPKGRPKGAKNKTKPPRKITLPTGRAMDEAITKIQQQLLIEKDKLKKSNGGTMNKQSQLGARLMYTIDRINRDKSLSKPRKRAKKNKINKSSDSCNTCQHTEIQKHPAEIDNAGRHV